ncbi:MAG: four helix bundle protein [Ruminococcaceae bacterium]|nr:four helix bundle protein [Oscillospiraceae bacterium]
MQNVIAEKSFQFAIRTVNVYKYLCANKNEYVMSKQLLRSGTSIGANIAESKNAQSRADFISKLNIALKEATETKYWIRLLYATEYLNDAEYQSYYADGVELEKLLVSIVKSLKQ